MKLKGLLKKDYILLWTQMKLLLLMSVIFLVVSATAGSSAYYLGISILLAAMFPISILNYDERSNWNLYAITMPHNKSDIVLSKFVMSFIDIFAFAVFFVLVSLCRSVAMHEGIDIKSTIESIYVFVCFGFLYSAVIYPFAFALGSEKSRLVSILVTGVGVGAVSAILAITGENADYLVEMMSKHGNLLKYLLAPASLVLFLLSGMASISLYKRKKL